MRREKEEEIACAGLYFGLVGFRVTVELGDMVSPE